MRECKRVNHSETEIITSLFSFRFLKSVINLKLQLKLSEFIFFFFVLEFNPPLIPPVLRVDNECLINFNEAINQRKKTLFKRERKFITSKLETLFSKILFCS